MDYFAAERRRTQKAGIVAKSVGQPGKKRGQEGGGGDTQRETHTHTTFTFTSIACTESSRHLKVVNIPALFKFFTRWMNPRSFSTAMKSNFRVTEFMA